MNEKIAKKSGKLPERRALYDKRRPFSTNLYANFSHETSLFRGDIHRCRLASPK